MSHILLGTMPNTGHVRPGLELARSLVAAGHEVTWYTGSSYGSSVSKTGATFVPMPPHLDFSDDSLLQLTIDSGAKPGLPALKWALLNFFIKPVPGWVGELEVLAQRVRPDVIVAEHTFVAGLLLSEKLGIPCVAFSTTPLVVSSIDTAPFGTGLAPSASALGRARNRALNWFFQHVIMGSVQKAANKARADVGLPPRASFFLNWNFELATRYLAATIQEFEYPRSDLPPRVRFTGAINPPEPRDWQPPSWWADVAAARQEGRPVIVVTQGTLATEMHKLMLPAIRGLADLDALVIGTTGGADPESVLPSRRRPANLRLESFIPFASLLPQVDLVVTNGGYGGTQQALSAGIPIVAAGKTEDKMEVCARVKWSGVGVSLESDEPSAEQIAAGVRRVLAEPRFRERAQQFKALHAKSPGVANAVSVISEVAGRDSDVS